MRTYDIKIQHDGRKITLKFRLTLGAQLKLKKKHDSNALSLLYDAIDDAELMTEVLTEALNYSGSTNEITDGAELYDILVDNGICGMDGFAKLLLMIGVESGLLTEKQADATIKKMSGIIDEAIDEIGREGTEKNA